MVTDGSEDDIHKVGEVATEVLLEIAQPLSKLQSWTILTILFLPTTTMTKKKNWKLRNY